MSGRLFLIPSMAAIGATPTEGQLGLVVCAGLAAVVLVLSGVVRAAGMSATYPSYWDEPAKRFGTAQPALSFS